MEIIAGPKECKSCGEKALNWNKQLHEEIGVWRLSKVIKLSDGTLKYETHNCPKFQKKKEEPKEELWVRPSLNGLYCANHDYYLVPQDYNMGICSKCLDNYNSLLEKGIKLTGVAGRPAVIEIIC